MHTPPHCAHTFPAVHTLTYHTRAPPCTRSSPLCTHTLCTRIRLPNTPSLGTHAQPCTHTPSTVHTRPPLCTHTHLPYTHTPCTCSPHRAHTSAVHTHAPIVHTHHPCAQPPPCTHTSTVHTPHPADIPAHHTHTHPLCTCTPTVLTHAPPCIKSTRTQRKPPAEHAPGTVVEPAACAVSSLPRDDAVQCLIPQISPPHLFYKLLKTLHAARGNFTQRDSLKSSPARLPPTCTVPSPCCP